MKTFPITIGKGRGALKLDAETLIGTRCLVQGKSGSGKSHLVRVIVEQTMGHGVQTIIFDPSGDFKTLREKCDLLIAGNEKDGADVPLELRSAKQLLRRVAETGISCLLDMSDLSKKDRREFVRIALDTLHNLPRKYWAPRIIVVDECQEYAPESGKGKSTALESVIETANQGRKRGHCLIAVTLRLSALSKDVTAELQNKFIGTTDHIDLKRAQDALGSTVEQREKLRKLPPGEYFATGPALNNSDLVLFQGRASQTTHPKPGTQHRVKMPPPSRSVKRRILQDFEALPPSQEVEAAQTLAQARAEVKRLTRALAKAEKGGKDSVRLTAMEKRLAAAEQAVERAKGALDKAEAAGQEAEHRRFTRALHKLPGGLRALARKPLTDVPAALEAAAVAVEEALLVAPPPVAPGAAERLGGRMYPSGRAHHHGPGTTTGRTQTRAPNEAAAPSRGKKAKRKGKMTHKVSAGDTMTPHFVEKLPFSWKSAPGRLLTVLIQYHPEGLDKKRWATLAGLNFRKSTVGNAIRTLQEIEGLINNEGDSFWVQEQAHAMYEQEVEPLPSGADIIKGWQAKLGGAKLACFNALLEAGGSGERDGVITDAGYDPNKSTAGNTIRDLQNLGLVQPTSRGDGDLTLAEHILEAMD